MKRKVFSTAAIAASLSFFAGISTSLAEETPLLDQIQDKVTLHGTIEVDLTIAEDFEGASTSDIELATADFSLESALTDWTTGTIALTWNGDDDKIEVDEAFITLGNAEKYPLSLQAGRFVVPFGVYETNCLSDSLTKEIFETKEDAVMVTFESNGLYAKAYVFNGDTNEGGGDDAIEHFGVNVGYAYESDGFSADFGVGYLNSAIDADGLTEWVENSQKESVERGATFDENTSFLNADYAGGIALSSIVKAGAFTLIGEYIALLDDYEMNFVHKGNATTFSKKPQAWQLEVAYTTEIIAKETVFALSYSETEDLGEAFPESRLAAAVSVGLTEGVNLALEYCHDEDYDTSEGGTDESAELVTVRLAYEF